MHFIGVVLCVAVDTLLVIVITRRVVRSVLLLLLAFLTTGRASGYGSCTRA